jgi:hypothetical protein
VNAVLVACAAIAALAACQRAPAGGSDVTSATVSAASAPAVASAPVPKPKAWYEGRWSGSYEAVLDRIELDAGGVRAWKEDDGQRASGKGTLVCSVTPEGIASGQAEGPLGELLVSGVADEQGLRLSLSPKGDDPNGFRGTLLATRTGEQVTGTLSASSGDSLTVRKAKVELRPSAP